MIASADNVERMSREELQTIQLERLKKVVAWAEEKSKFYREKFAKANVCASDIETLDDIVKLPFVTKSDIRHSDPLSRLTVPYSGIVRYHHSETLTGDYVHLYTKGDKDWDAELVKRTMIAAGVSSAAVVGLQGDLTDSRLMGVQSALEEIGAMAVPLGVGHKIWMKLLENVGMDTLISTPQLIMQLIIQLQASGKNIADYPVKRIICINLDNIQNPLQAHIEERTKTKVFNLYASQELSTAGMLYQCKEHLGQHVAEDAFLAEIVAFGSDAEVKEEHRMGELVITTLTAEAMPLIRYRTGQAVSKTLEPCACGRTFMRIATPFSYL